MKIDPALAASVALDLYPESIRKDILDRTSLALDLQIPMTTFVGLGRGIDVERKHFYDAIRAALSNPPVLYTFQDSKGAAWTACQEIEQSEPYVVLKNGEERIVVNGFSPLNPDQVVRTEQFIRAAKNSRMPIEEYDRWHARIKSHRLEDDEAATLLEVLSESPGVVEKEIVESIQFGTAKFSTLIPDRTKYFETLVGAPVGGLDFHEYVKNVLKPHFEGVLHKYRVEGLQAILCTCWHREITSAIDLTILTWDEVGQAIRWAARHGDMVSKHGAVELAIPIISRLEDVDASIIQMIDTIRHDDHQNGELVQLADVIRLVEGELARTTLFPQAAPYWRRLATFTHAAILHRAMKVAGANGKNLAETNCYGRVQPFLMQSMVDLRVEPRWQASYLSGSQLKAEFLGRILHVTDQFKDTLTPDVHTYLYGESPLRDALQLPDIFIPGPLEGAENGPLSQLPSELESGIEIRHDDGRVELSSFIPLINSAMIFKLDSEKADLASDAIRVAKFQIRTDGNTEELLPLLMGLASLATTTRNVTLTEDITQLVRNLRFRNPSLISVTQAWWIGMTAAASHSNEDSWCSFVGAWSTEIAYQEMSTSEARGIRESLVLLCRIVPQLWLRCGQAIACLDSFTS